MGWEIVEGQDGHQHVMPVHDVKPHWGSASCWCHPYPDHKDENVIIHNAVDGRLSEELPQ